MTEKNEPLSSSVTSLQVKVARMENELKKLREVFIETVNCLSSRIEDLECPIYSEKTRNLI